MSINPYVGVAAALVVTGAIVWQVTTANDLGSKDAELLASAVVGPGDLPFSVEKTHTAAEESDGAMYRTRLGIETDWNEACAVALEAGSEEFPAAGRIMREFQVADRDALNPAFAASATVVVVPTSAPTDGALNPAARYLNHLGQVCGGVELNHPDGLSYQGVAVSDHEFGTVVTTPEGEYWRTMSAYAVPGCIVWVDGSNVSTDQVREISATQSAVLAGETPFTGPMGDHTRGLAERIRDLMGSVL